MLNGKLKRSKRSQRPGYRPRLERLENRLLLTTETEPNNSLATANSITAPDVVSGQLSTLADVDYFKINLTAGARFQILAPNYLEPVALNLPPAIEVLDNTGSVLRGSSDGKEFEITATRTAVYFVRVTSDTAFGAIAQRYSFLTSIIAYSGATEVEPNDGRLSANPIPFGAFRGTLSTTDPADFFSVNLNANTALFVNFNGQPAQRPGVRLWSPTGSLLASGLAGQGLAVNIQSAGLHTIEVLDNSGVGQTEFYVGVVQSTPRALFLSDMGDGFDQATVVPAARDSTYLGGQLTSLNDVDIYSVSMTTLSQMLITLQVSGAEAVPTYDRTITVFDKRGVLVTTSVNGQLYLPRQMSSTPGEYFVVVGAASSSGLGNYGLRLWNLDDFSNQREVPLHLLDFTGQLPENSIRLLKAFAVPEAIPYITAFWRSRFSAYDIDWTYTRPDWPLDRYFQSVFGDLENVFGGLGGGVPGRRRPHGQSHNNHEDTEWSMWHAAGVLIHEFGHMGGLWHIRDISSDMSYVRSDFVITNGTHFRFDHVNQFRPYNTVVNDRDWLDWNFGAGAQVPEMPSDLNNPQALDNHFKEMNFELSDSVRHYPTGPTPTHLVSGDLNGDGWKDIIVSQVGSTLSVYLSDARGGFLPARNYDVSPFQWWTESVTSADFNRDGRDDVAITSRDQETLTIMLSSPDGTLVAGPTQSIGRWPNVIQAVDMNGDGNVDLVAAGANNQVTVMRGRGDGTFLPGQSFGTGSDPNHMVLMDFNGDGRVDIATTNYGSDSVSVLLANLSGGYNISSIFPVGEVPRGMTAGDYDGDGDIDLAVSNHALRTLTIYTNRGDGSFDKGMTYDLSVFPENLTTADLNQDGLPDIIASGNSFAIDILMGAAQGTFSRPISYPVPSGGVNSIVLDVNRDGVSDIATISFWNNQLYVQTGLPNNPRNDRVVVYGRLDTAQETDVYSLRVAAGSEFAFDIDAAEFQYPLDAELTILSSSGAVLASNQQAIDRESGLDSVDPYIVSKFTETDTIRIVVSSQHGSAGAYRLKVTPSSALKRVGPRVLGVFPENRSFVDSTRQILFMVDASLDATSFTSDAIIVRGAQTGVRSGTAYLDPLDNILVWTADAPLPIDIYTVTLVSGPLGVRDMFGNELDGEIASDFKPTTISGDGTPGGNFVSTFTVQRIDSSPAAINFAAYERDPSNRGKFMLRWDDRLLFSAIESAEFTLRGAGPDGQFDTADDRLQSLDPIYYKIGNAVAPHASVDLYTRGYPDSDLYRIESMLTDESGNLVPVYQQINVGSTVPESSLFTSAARTQGGLTGSYVNRSLRTVAAPSDWRTTQTISGTRVDHVISFSGNAWGSRSEVGITGGTDADWDNFSVQWDGVITIPRNGTRLHTRSDDGSRLWIDVNQNGQFDANEIFDNGWGQGQSLTDGGLTPGLPAGNYLIRLQYEESIFANTIYLEWIEPDVASSEKGHIHGPLVIGVSIQPGSAYRGPVTNRLDIDFSGAMDASTLTPANVRLRYSPNPDFYDGNDVYISDADGKIEWDAVRRRATFQASSVFQAGYYLLELNGSAGGIRNTAGQLLDGEFLINYIAGNSNILSPSRQVSGNGLPGGDYRAAFSIANALGLTFAATTVSENSGTTLATVSRNGAGPNAIVVNLTSSDVTVVTVPATVTIPAGAISAMFTVTVADDSLADGDQVARVTALSPGYVSGSAVITVIDDEQPTLTLTVNPTSISENGGVGQVTISRNTPTQLPLVVTLASSNIAAATVPATLTIPAGAVSAMAIVNAVDDTLADGDQIAVLTATSTGFLSGSAPIIVVDDETATLRLSLSPTSISENGGRTIATLTRNTPTTTPLVVGLSSSDSRWVSMPATITFPVGASSASFFISAINDSFAYGNQTVTITAAANGFLSGVSTLNVLEDDDAAISLTLSSGWMSENGGTVVATVLRNTSTATALTVNITSSDITAATVPHQVVIAAGSTEVSFEILAVDDLVADGTQLTTIVASAAGFQNGIAQLSVTDDEVATLVMTTSSSSISERDGQATVTVTRNTPTTTPLTIHLSNDMATKLSAPPSVTIAVGALSATFVVHAIDDALAFGDQLATLRASAAGFLDGSVQILLRDDDAAALQVVLASTSVLEGSGTTTGTVVRNTPHGNNLVVSLSSSDLSVAAVATATVTIPAGSASAQFVLNVIDDELADGPQLAIISATAAGYATGSAQLEVRDDDVAALRLSVSNATISENGGTAVVTVARNTPMTSAVEIAIGTNATNLLSFPPRVVIPSGEEAISFVVTGVDDALVQGQRLAILNAAASGLTEANLILTVTDDDLATLSLVFTPESMAELGGTSIGRVERNSPTDHALIVILSSAYPSAVSFPATVIIPAGASSAVFSVSAVNNQIAVGTQSVEFIASSAGFVAGRALLSVVDDDVPRLTLNLTTSSAAENGGPIWATVERNTPTGREQVVMLSTDASGRVSVPSSVVIAVGAHSVGFQVMIVDDRTFSGDEVAVISATAPDHEPASTTLLVVEDEANLPWHNLRNPLDVNADGSVSPIDALLIINYLNSRNPSLLPSPTIGNGPPPYLDVNGDGSATAIDALLVINRLNQGPASEGEQPETNAQHDLVFEDFEWLEGLFRKTRPAANLRLPNMRAINYPTGVSPGFCISRRALAPVSALADGR